MWEEGGLENRLGYGGIEEDVFVRLPEGENEEELKDQGRNKQEAVLNKLSPPGDYL